MSSKEQGQGDAPVRPPRARDSTRRNAASQQANLSAAGGSGIQNRGPLPDILDQASVGAGARENNNSAAIDNAPTAGSGQERRSAFHPSGQHVDEQSRSAARGLSPLELGPPLYYRTLPRARPFPPELSLPPLPLDEHEGDGIQGIASELRLGDHPPPFGVAAYLPGPNAEQLPPKGGSLRARKPSRQRQASGGDGHGAGGQRDASSHTMPRGQRRGQQQELVRGHEQLRMSIRRPRMRSQQEAGQQQGQGAGNAPHGQNMGIQEPAYELDQRGYLIHGDRPPARDNNGTQRRSRRHERQQAAVEEEEEVTTACCCIIQ